MAAVNAICSTSIDSGDNRFADIIYERLARPLLFLLDAERAHRLTLALLALKAAGAPKSDPALLHTRVFGLEFSNPVGLAAGVDKDARAVNAWNAMGFGFAEIGTVTPRPQPGNELPRMWRLREQRALINRLGFPSAGMEAIARRLARIRRRELKLWLAVNIGPNKETAAEHVAQDYADLMSRLGRFADFVVVNVSSPNTAGLREFQAPERLRTIVAAIRGVASNSARPPLLIKLAPDLEAPMLREICAAAIELELDGIVAVNTTLKREEVGVSSALMGGLSGQPLKARARAVIAEIYNCAGGRMPIIGVGGIASAQDAYAHIRAGASLVELYTGMVYRGPGIVRAIKTGLERLLDRDGFRSISAAVGTAAGE